MFTGRVERDFHDKANSSKTTTTPRDLWKCVKDEHVSNEHVKGLLRNGAIQGNPILGICELQSIQ